MHAVNETTKPIRRGEAESQDSYILTLADVPVGGAARIVQIIGEDEPFFRLTELGFVEGEIVRVMKRAPLGDPIEIRIMNYDLCIRIGDAAFVRVNLMGDPVEMEGGANGTL